MMNLKKRRRNWICRTKKFDYILANINRNILLRDIPEYTTCLNANGFLFLSGFYENDIPEIQDVCVYSNLALEMHISSNEWAALKFKKQ